MGESFEDQLEEFVSMIEEENPTTEELELAKAFLQELILIIDNKLN